MNVLSVFVISCLLAITLSACTASVNSGGPRYEGAGITFVVPLQTSQVTNGPNGIDYRSDNLNASTDGKMLRVNGKSYGSVKSGDVVDFTTVGQVMVNGVARAADGA